MRHQFGVFEFDSDSGELRKNGRVSALEPQPAKALALLVLRAGEVVSREEIRDAVWGRDTHVDFDRGLAYCVSQVRSALGDSAENPRFVQTIPKRGFKFIAPVETSIDAYSGQAKPGPRRVPIRQLSWLAVVIVFAVGSLWLARAYNGQRVLIAVSVFDNETGAAEYDRPVAGLSDLVVEHLTKIDPDRIGVIGNAAILRQPRNIRNLKAIGDNIKADYVLLGQLQKGESGLRFITHFIRLQDGAHLKANRLTVSGPDLAGLEAAVVDEFERAVRQHVLNRASN